MQTSYKRDYSALYIGKVLDNLDPKGLGRCKIDIPDIYGTMEFSLDSLPWAIPLVPATVSGGRGAVNIPDVGDIVWVLFLGANRSSPVYIGGVYSTADSINVNPRVVDIYMEDGNKISYNRDSKEYTIGVGSNTVEISPSGIRLEGDVTIVGSLQVTDSINAGQNINAGHRVSGQSGSINGSDIATEGMSSWDMDSIMEALDIKEEDLENMTEEEKKSYLFFQEIIAAGDTDNDPNTPPDESAMAAKAKELGVGGNGLTGGYCQAFALWSTRAAQGTSKGVDKYDSAMDCMNNANLSKDFSNIPVGATIVGNSTYTPAYGHAVVYAGDGMVMHVVDTGEIRYQSLESLTSEGWFSPQGWTDLYSGGDNQ